MKKYVHFRGKKIFYSEKGFGKTIILVHGYLESGEIWDPFSARLAEKYRVIQVDLPGHGGSDIYEETHSMEFMASVLEGLMNSLGLEKAFITGHSLGGYIALAFLENFPARLSGYCLFHSHPFPDTSQVIQKREREILIVKAGKKFLMYPDNVRRMFADHNLPSMYSELERSKRIASEISAEGIIAVLKGMMLRPSRLGLMEAGKVPCLWILGASDNYIDPGTMKERVTLPANAELVVLKSSGHLGFVEETDTTAASLLEFIDKKALW
ncbi:MAG TPA: alpha/beta hydrolase [Bacteroidales bacterium]|nr:alpha/beta hydrolase [Bacteroidales bacterium]